MRLPLFPLHTVLFPDAPLPLHIFEDRYRRLISSGADFGVVLIREGREVGQAGAVGPSGPELFEVGTVAHVERVAALPDGRYNILARGVGRFRVVSVDAAAEPYLVAEVEEITEPAAPRRPETLRGVIEEYLLELGVTLSPETAGRADLVWMVGAILQAEPRKLQPLLETGDSLLAEQLISRELARLRAMGMTAAFSPRPPAPN